MELVENKVKFLNILQGCKRNGIDDLVKWLETTDFFEAPASSAYHSNVKGGLCQHSLNVYNNLIKLNNLLELNLDKDSMTIVSLLHDISKTNYYESYIQNKKNYNDSGKQSDEQGRFDWVQVQRYKVKDSSDRDYVYAEHCVNSFIIVNKFLHLDEAETAAIINHHMGMDLGNIRPDISEIYNRYPLAFLLHTADTMATYLDENPYIVNE